MKLSEICPYVDYKYLLGYVLYVVTLLVFENLCLFTVVVVYISIESTARPFSQVKVLSLGCLAIAFVCWLEPLEEVSITNRAV